MQRYFTSEKLNESDSYEIVDKDTHHMINVMRFRVDDHFEMVDRDQNSFLCRVVDISPGKVAYMAIEENSLQTELPFNITVVCPLLKGEKFEWMLQKSTELGASEFLIYEADRSIVKLDEKKRARRLERYGKVIKEASEQSKRLVIPQITFKGRLEEIDFSNYTHTVLAYEGHAKESSYSIHNLERFKDGQSIAFIFGPEGGLTKEETTFDNSLKSVRLGPRILRAETAPLYFLSSISCLYE